MCDAIVVLLCMLSMNSSDTYQLGYVRHGKVSQLVCCTLPATRKILHYPRATLNKQQISFKLPVCTG